MEKKFMDYEKKIIDGREFVVFNGNNNCRALLQKRRFPEYIANDLYYFEVPNPYSGSDYSDGVSALAFWEKSKYNHLDNLVFRAVEDGFADVVVMKPTSNPFSYCDTVSLAPIRFLDRDFGEKKRIEFLKENSNIQYKYYLMLETQLKTDYIYDSSDKSKKKEFDSLDSLMSFIEVKTKDLHEKAKYVFLHMKENKTTPEIDAMLEKDAILEDCLISEVSIDKGYSETNTFHFKLLPCVKCSGNK